MTNDAAPRNEKVRAISVRFSEQDAVRVDAHTDRLRRKNPAIMVSRTDALRDLLRRGLDDAERSR